MVLGLATVALVALPSAAAQAISITCVSPSVAPCTYFDPAVKPVFRVVLTPAEVGFYDMTANDQPLSSGNLAPGGTYDLSAPVSESFEGVVLLHVNILTADAAEPRAGQQTYDFSAQVDYLPPPAPRLSAPSGVVTDPRPGVSVSHLASGPASLVGAALAVDGPAPASPNRGLESPLRPDANLSDGAHAFRIRSCDQRPTCGPESIATVLVDATPPGAPRLTSTSHPYGAGRRRDVAFSWTPQPDVAGTAGYSFALDHAADTTPPPVSQGNGTGASFANLAPGTWWFHVRTQDALGRWGLAAHFVVKVLLDPDPAPPSQPAPPAAPTHWFLAEGSTGPGFDTWILLANPADHALTAHLTYLTPRGPVPGPEVVVEAGSRMSVHANDTVTDDSVSTEVVADGGVIVERAMYVSRDARRGAHSTAAVSAPSDHWAFPEGSSGAGFETWLLLANPSPAPITATIYFQTSRSGLVTAPRVVLAARTRISLRVNDLISDPEVASLVFATGPVYAERATYVVGGGRPLDATASTGATASASDWLAAEGAAGPGFETWVLVQNPGSRPVTATISFQTPQGVVAPAGLARLSIDPGRRTTVRVNDWVTSDEVATLVHADGGVVVERASYYDRPGLRGATTDLAAARADTVWYAAEGATAGGFETWLLLANPDPTRVAEVTVTYLTGGGPVAGPRLHLAPGTRVSVRESDAVGSTYQSAAVISSTNGVPIAVERSTFDGQSAQGGRTVPASAVLDAAGL